jgi:hypothetical protein
VLVNGIIEAAHRPAPHRAFRVAASTAPVIRIRAPAANSISIALQAPEGAFLGPFNLAFHAAPAVRREVSQSPVIAKDRTVMSYPATFAAEC